MCYVYVAIYVCMYRDIIIFYKIVHSQSMYNEEKQIFISMLAYLWHIHCITEKYVHVGGGCPS